MAAWRDLLAILGWRSAQDAPLSESSGIFRNGKPVLEVQYHPADIRKGVRYFFLDTGRVRLLAWGLCLYGIFVAGSLFVIPGTVADLFAFSNYDKQVDARVEEGDQLKQLVTALSALDAKVKDLRVDLDKIRLAYGLPEEVAKGQGGFPIAPAEVPQGSIHGAAIRQGNGLLASTGQELGVISSLFEEVAAFEAANRGQVRSTPSLSPLRGEEFVLTSPFGARTSPFTRQLDFHAGIDMAARPGTPILAPAEAVVAFAGRYPLKENASWWRYGNLVALRHGDLFVTVFGHCDEVKVAAGQRVRQGDIIATVGSTGWSTSPHLHYEVRRRLPGGGFEPIDPRVYILNHRWTDEERVLIRARHAPDGDFEPLPDIMIR